MGIIKIDRSRRDGTFVGFVGNSFQCPGNLSLGLKGAAVVLRLLLSPTHYKAVIQLIYCFGRLWHNSDVHDLLAVGRDENAALAKASHSFNETWYCLEHPEAEENVMENSNWKEGDVKSLAGRAAWQFPHVWEDFRSWSDKIYLSFGKENLTPPSRF